jgi:hypothetical protein
MNFISSELVILLIVTIFLCSFLRGRAVTWTLLVASFVFYGWWNPPYVSLLIVVIASSWIGGLAIERYRKGWVLCTVVLGESRRQSAACSCLLQLSGRESSTLDADQASGLWSSPAPGARTSPLLT